MLRAGSSSYRLAGDVARRFVTAWWSRDGATAFALADTSFRGDAGVLADGENRGSPTFVVSSVGPLGHGTEGDTIARVCGPDVLPAVVAVSVHGSKAAIGARIYLVLRPQGFRVWAVR
jgi:hypothetical protein